MEQWTAKKLADEIQSALEFDGEGAVLRQSAPGQGRDGMFVTMGLKGGPRPVFEIDIRLVKVLNGERR